MLAAIPRGVVCPDEIRIGWLDTPPYLTYKENVGPESHHVGPRLTGPIMDLTFDGLKECCRNNFTIQYERNFYNIDEMVESSVNSSLDLVFPIRSSVGKDMFIAFPFIGLGEYVCISNSPKFIQKGSFPRIIYVMPKYLI